MKGIILSTGLFLIIVGCRKEPQRTESPCITDKVQEFSESTFCDSGASVKEFIFKGEYVYVFNNGICGADFAHAVVNSECETIGFLGGFMGNTEIDGDNFNEEAEYKRTLFSN